MIPLWRLMLPLAWRWPWMSAAQRAAQVDLDTRARIHRATVGTVEAAYDPVVDEALGLVKPVENALDVGAGTGLYTVKIRAMRQYANEPVEALWTQCTRRDRRIQRVGGDATTLELASGTVDLVTVFHVLHHLADRPRAGAEWARVLRPGGRLLLVEPRHTWRRALRLAWYWGREYRHTVDPFRYATHDFCTRGEVRRLCTTPPLELLELQRRQGHIVALAWRRP